MKPIVPILMASALIALVSCDTGNDDIRVYQVSYPEDHEHASPSQPQPGAGMTPPMARPPSMTPLPGMTEAAAAVETPDWSVPAAWEELPPTPIRKGNFRAGPVQITVTVFPDDVGGLEANVNRWRQQVGLGPLSADQLGEVTRPITVDGKEATFVDLASVGTPTGQGILGGVIPRDSRTWFVKAMGPLEPLNQQQASLESFLQSISF